MRFVFQNNSFYMFVSNCITFFFKVSESMGPTPRMGGELLEKISEQMNNICPLDKLAERRAWRDACLTKLSLLKKDV